MEFENKMVTLIDLTHPITGDIPTWDGKPAFKLDIERDYREFKPPYLFRTHKFECAAGIGTHIDAPAHMILRGRTVEELSLRELTAECIVIDVSQEAHEDYEIMPRALDKYEKSHGEIPAASFVLFYTGWDKYWDTPAKYINDYHFPSLHYTTAEALIERGVAGVGIDTLSFDTGRDGFPAHKLLLNEDRYLIENIANAGRLPYVGSQIIALPMHLVGATEAPVRLVALI